MQRGTSLMSKLAGKPKYEDERGNRKWIHQDKQLIDNFVVYQAKFLGSTEVDSPRGIDVVKDAIKKIQFQHEIKKSEAGKKGSKLQKVEFWVSIDVIKIVNLKTKDVITQRPLHRISYCADDHNDKKLFSFIAKEQESKTHNCFAFITEREAAEFTVTLGQAFELAYKRYLAKGKQESKENKEIIDLKKQVEQAKAENLALKQRLDGSDGDNDSRRSHSINSNDSGTNLKVAPPSNQEAQPSLLFDFGTPQSQEKPPQEEGFDPFDKYLTNLATKRGLGSAETPDHLQDRGPFQSPLQKNPSENPFEKVQEAPSNPFDLFFNSDSVLPQDSEREAPAVIASSNSSSIVGGNVHGFLPPPPSKQSIKAANAVKMKANKTKSEEVSAGGNNSNGIPEPVEPVSQDLFDIGVPSDPSLQSLEKSLGSGLQFDSFNFDPLQ